MDLIPSLTHIRYNIEILERDYSHLRSTLCFSDVIFDEHVGMVICCLGDLNTHEGFKYVTSRITGLSLQFEKLWILLYNSEYGRCEPLLS